MEKKGKEGKKGGGRKKRLFAVFETDNNPSSLFYRAVSGKGGKGGRMIKKGESSRSVTHRVV